METVQLHPQTWRLSSSFSPVVKIGSGLLATIALQRKPHVAQNNPVLQLLHASSLEVSLCYDSDAMGNTWITDIRHFLDENGSLIQQPRAARLLAAYIGSIISAITRRSVYQEDQNTDIACRRRPGRNPCAGKIIAGFDAQDPSTIVWCCPVCEDNGSIRGWQETQFDKR